MRIIHDPDIRLCAIRISYYVTRWIFEKKKLGKERDKFLLK